MKHLEPDESFTPVIKKALPQDDIIVVKLAQSGQPIRRWYLDWPPAGHDTEERTRPPGDLLQSTDEIGEWSASIQT